MSPKTPQKIDTTQTKKGTTFPVDVETSNPKIKAYYFPQEIRRRVKELGINPRRLSAMVDSAYDYVRKVYNGENFPGDNLIISLCEALDLDLDTMRNLDRIDRGLAEGMIPLEYTDIDPAHAHIAKFWAHLTTTDKQDLIEMARLKAERNINNTVAR